MELFTVHKCEGPKLKCFDCSRQICPSCLVTTSTSLMCKQCAPGKTAKTKPAAKSAGVAVADVVKLEAASVSYSAVAFSLMSMFASCVT